ncbi:MAG: NosD domain-containing protein [Candidatus Heimdallarchaeaceae archaeon]
MRNKIRLFFSFLSIIITVVCILTTLENTTVGNRFPTSSQIIIMSDSDFDTYGFPGSGSLKDPYIIEGLNISGEGDIGIFIANTYVSYYIIRNCVIQGYDFGIVIDSSYKSATIENCEINANSVGITVTQSTSFYVINNAVQAHSVGITVDAAYNAIVNNTIFDTAYGITASIVANEGLILNNTITNAEWGITTDIEVKNTQICWNSIINVYFAGIGINTVDDVTNLTIHHNTIIAGEEFDYETLGRQEGVNDQIFWYDSETSEGNYWSDWSQVGEYDILDIQDEKTNSDLYPLTEAPTPQNAFPSLPINPEDKVAPSTPNPTSNDNSEEDTNSLTLNINVILITSVILTLIRSRKLKKQQ